MSLYSSFYDEDYMIESISADIMNSIFSECVDSETLLESTELDYIEEGANTEYVKLLNNTKKIYKNHLNMAKKYSNANNFGAALKEIDEAERVIQEAKKKLLAIDGGVLSTIVGVALMFVKAVVQDMITTAIYSAIGGGVAMWESLKMLKGFKGNIQRLQKSIQHIGSRENIDKAIKSAKPKGIKDKLDDIKAPLPNEGGKMTKALAVFGKISSVLNMVQTVVNVYNKLKAAPTKEEKIKCLNTFREAIGGTLDQLANSISSTKEMILLKQENMQQQMNVATATKAEPNKK